MNAKRIVRIEDYEQYIGAETVDRIKKKASRHKDLHVATDDPEGPEIYQSPSTSARNVLLS